MSMFSPFKKHARPFAYVPRYYDPAKEAREQRRAEMRGERSDDNTEYTPGKYIRTQREAREVHRATRDRGHGRILKLVAVVAVLFFLAYLFLPQLLNSVATAKKSPAPVEEYSDFDPSAPITIVPNDYQE